MEAEYMRRLKRNIYAHVIPATTTEEVARQRLEAILSDKLLWFNPYRVADRALIDCAERGRWSPFPAITQMMVFHFHQIQTAPAQNGIAAYDAVSFHIGNTDTVHHFGLKSLTHPFTHMVSRQPVWNLLNGQHLVESNIRRIQRKDIFVSHAINCVRVNNGTRQAYRMHRLSGSDAQQATTLRESMYTAKLTMLEEILQYPIHPDYLGNPCLSFDYTTPLRQAIAAIQRFPDATPPTTHCM